jgi:mono/diheme cytochrome c family protein
MRCDVIRQMRHAVVVIGIGCAFVLLGCGSDSPQPPPGLNEAQMAGWRAYVDLNCASCHGEDREGKRAGPPLVGLAAHWTADKLVRYLEDPDAMVRSDPYIASRAERYALGMPKASGKTPGYADKAREATLEALAEYLLVDLPRSGS